MLVVSGVAVEVQKKRIKHMHLYIKPDGRVLLTAPLGTSDRAIEHFVNSKTSWIQKHLAEYEEKERRRPHEYVSGEPLYVWGNRYTLEVTQGKHNSLMLLGDTALLTTRQKSTAEGREKFVREWYRAALKREIEQIVPKWEVITGLKASSWQTRYMTSRWGSCNTKTGKICFNVQLATKPRECLEYVVVHELVHLAERGHGERFKALMSRFMPQWKEVRARLNH